MASFARGFRLLSCPRAPLTPRTILPNLSSAQSRFFTASMRLRASATPKPQPKLPKDIKSKSPTSQTNAPPAPPSASVAPSRYAFVKSLASKQTPTLLYEAPSHFWFYFGCWSSGISIIAWTVLTGPTAIQQPEGIPQWVGFTFGASYALLGAMGFYLISKTPNIVSSIRVLPPLQAAGQAATRPGIAAGVPQLEVTVKRMVPLLQPKVIRTDLDKVALKTRFSLPSEYVPELRRLELQLEEEARKKSLWKFDMEHLFTMPFRRIGRAFVNMFKGVRAAWTDVGYGIIKVDGKQYKVDVTKGYAHDGFRTLERVVTVGWK
ncbi:uncharacterized protein TRIVIDRAFT_40909 [Trichoderma virens Gv29-8]|uniref:Uncharacterized protein n=1 Tax=Hypocrea virens (strain Gv29-8 / FGSC 10586) TaxID=413071 RepID=G9N9M9_HYPVG|nr:uncharacterized protein TRIVIDRAFT_40909 [Trichoderma virens Gv29-8]EHK16647.1 hypothetical protein TRIVIDRAFT_40909 [Trichoderma virens Gv29-8]UKZ51974.1 hypothetical protein TrVGV298_005741 [Trichoderma virens]